MKLHLDFETASRVDLPVRGLMNYVTDPSTFVLLAAWAIDDGPVRQASFDEGFDELRRDIEAGYGYTFDENGDDVLVPPEIHAWNAPFEWAIMHYVLGWPVQMDAMHCTMAHALYRAFPAKLDSAAQAMIGRGKRKDSTRLMKLWSMGIGKIKPGDWEAFCEYNRDDVEMERDIHRFLLDNRLLWPTQERAVWRMGEKINWRGVPVSVDDARAAKFLHDQVTEVALAEIKDITGIENPNSAAQISSWLMCGSLDKKHMPDLLAQHEGAERRVLELRQQVALSAPKKYTVAIEQEHGGRLRNMLQYSGAGRTHRWSGRALQPQNLRRGWKSDDKIAEAWRQIHSGEAADLMDDPYSVLADLVRSIITPGPGYELVVADYSSIEVVMLHWAAGDKAMLDDLRAGLDAYKRYAAKHWDTSIEKVSKEQRTFSKPVVLGAGYGLGKDTLVEYAKGMGVTMTVEEASAAISTYRTENAAVVQFWYDIEGGMRRAIQNPGKVYRVGHFYFTKRGRSCLLRLPAGTEITYFDAAIEDDRITYWGVNQYTGHWSKITSWGGKLVENLVQSISRDVLVYGLQNAMAAGLDVILHVHDEIVVAADLRLGKATETMLVEGMPAPPWCSEAPIKAAAFRCPRYRKD